MKVKISLLLLLAISSQQLLAQTAESADSGFWNTNTIVSMVIGGLVGGIIGGWYAKRNAEKDAE